MNEIHLRFPLLSLLFVSSLLAASAQQTPIQIHADLSDAPRKIYHADVNLPVHRGPLDLITPEWIPGAHGPDGPVSNITGISFEVDDKTIPWRRDPVDTYEYHLEIPAGASNLHAHLDCIYSRASRTSATLEWEDLMLYPVHSRTRHRDPANSYRTGPLGNRHLRQSADFLRSAEPRRWHGSVRTHHRRDA